MENSILIADAVIAIEPSDYVDGLSPLTDGAGQDVDDLTELLESRAAQSSEETYYEVDEVFDHFGPWKQDSYRYKNMAHSQHPSGP